MRISRSCLARARNAYPRAPAPFLARTSWPFLARKAKVLMRISVAALAMVMALEISKAVALQMAYIENPNMSIPYSHCRQDRITQRQKSMPTA